MTRLKVTILGCGSSGGVPRADGEWGACNSINPKNYRTRCSILVEQFGENLTYPTRVLIDTSPDLRVQLLAAKVKKIDAVLFTHDHADQTHGIDDLRPIAFINRKRIDAYFDASTAKTLLPKFAYVFHGHERNNYPAILNHLTMPDIGQSLTISGEGGDLVFEPLELVHGGIMSLGFRFGNIAYCNDTNFIPPETMAKLGGLDLLIVDCLRYTVHPSHAHFDQTISWIAELKPKHAILTNLHIDLDYDELAARLPDSAEPAFDMMIWEKEL